MSNQSSESPPPSQPPVAENRRHRRNRARQVIGGLTTVAVLAAGQGYAQSQDSKSKAQAQRISAIASKLQTTQSELSRVGTIVGDLNDIPPGVALGTSLRSPETLPDYGKTVSPELRAQLAAATIKIGMRLKGTTGPWEEDCTGIVLDGNLVMTAAHCVKGQLGLPDKGGGPLPEAINVTAQSNSDYAIFDPLAPPSRRDLAIPMAQVSSVAIDLSGDADWVLMRATSNSTTPYRQLGVIEPLHLSQESPADKGVSAPTPGQAVALYSLPESAGGEPVIGTGVYLGRYIDVPGSITTFIDLVGIKASEPSADACDFGASGSSAMLASGQILGPLSMRNNLGYGPNDAFYYPDTASTGEKYRLMYEQAIELNLDEYTTICGYSTPETDTISNLTQVLADPSLVIQLQGGK